MRPGVARDGLFWSKVRKTRGCWLWIAARTSEGYGVIKRAGRVQYAHRLAYVELVGEIPAGQVIDHVCRVRHCVRPDHLDVVTIAENTARGARWNRELVPWGG